MVISLYVLGAFRVNIYFSTVLTSKRKNPLDLAGRMKVKVKKFFLVKFFSALFDFVDK